MADKGIRVNMIHKFLELLPQRKELGNTPFRKAVIGYAMTEFGATLASASTAYNKAFIEAKTRALTDPELAASLVGLGRDPAKNNGGRKPKAKVEGVVAPAGDPEREAGETAAPQELVTVKVKASGKTVAENVSLEDAQKLVAAAKAAKKSALYWV